MSPKDAESGLSLHGGMFVSLTDEAGTDIQQITPKFNPAATDAPQDGAFMIQEVDIDGVTSQTYFWLLADSPAASNGAGWYTFSAATGYTYATKKFEKGEGFFYQSSYYENVNEEELPPEFTVSGKVNQEAKTMGYDESGLCLRCNYFPTEYSIQKLIPTFPAEATDEPQDGAFMIQEVDVDGVTSETYIWLLAGSPSASNGAGWYTLSAGTGYTYATKMFEPGEGFFYQTAYYEDADGDEVTGTLQFTK